jgi:hypothetical protein
VAGDTAPLPTYRSLAAPVRKPVDKFALLPAFLKVSMHGVLIQQMLLPVSYVDLLSNNFVTLSF